MGFIVVECAFFLARKASKAGHWEKFTGWFPLQFAQVGGTSRVFLQLLDSCSPAHFTQTAFLLQLAEVWLCAWQRKHCIVGLRDSNFSQYIFMRSINLMWFICAMVVPRAKLTLCIGYLVYVGIFVQAIKFSPWFLMLLHILDSGSLMSPFRTTVQVFSALTVWYSMFSCLHIALKWSCSCYQTWFLTYWTCILLEKHFYICVSEHSIAWHDLCCRVRTSVVWWIVVWRLWDLLWVQFLSHVFCYFSRESLCDRLL